MLLIFFLSVARFHQVREVLLKPGDTAVDVGANIGAHTVALGRNMPTLIASPTRIAAAGNQPKILEEYVGRANTGHAHVSIAHMRSPAGWSEPGQTPEFEEIT